MLSQWFLGVTLYFIMIASILLVSSMLLSPIGGIPATALISYLMLTNESECDGC